MPRDPGDAPLNADSDSLDDYDFELPERLIAQTPGPERDASRLLVLDRAGGRVTHARFRELGRFLARGDLLVANRTRVVPARVFGHRESTGGRVEALFLGPSGESWDVLLKARGRLLPGETLELAGGAIRVALREKGERGRWTVAPLPGADGRATDLAASLEERGTMPLPPYIRRRAEDEEAAALDRERYQTVFAREAGAVAAPTAGLHFTTGLLDELEDAGVGLATVTLHVGLGTFRPIEDADYRRHRMHAERYCVPEETARRANATRAAGGRVVAVGTTSVRSLESAWDAEAGELTAREGETRLFLHPPLGIAAVDAMITNFHLPRSSLLLLVSAFAGRELVLDAYRQAVENEYRFFSYGDAMLIL